MAKGNVFFIPGYFGSFLLRAGGARAGNTLYMDKLALYVSGFRGLRLDQDGFGPDPNDGVWCRAGKPYPDYYDTLTNKLVDYGWLVHEGGYDWRQDLLQTGRAFKEDMDNFYQRKGKFSVLTHSMGALAFLATVYAYQQAGEEMPVDNVVFIAPPFNGNYQTARLFIHTEPTYQVVEDAVFKVTVRSYESIEGEIDSTVGSWPASYQLLARPKWATPYGNTGEKIYSNQTYLPVNNYVRQKWFDRAKDVWAILGEVAFDAKKAIVVGATGQNTCVYFDKDGSRFSDGNAVFDTTGDGVVPVWSYKRGFDAWLKEGVDHTSICYSEWLLDNIDAFLRKLNPLGIGQKYSRFVRAEDIAG